MSYLLGRSSSEYSDESVLSLDIFEFNQPKSWMKDIIKDASYLFVCGCVSFALFNCDRFTHPCTWASFACLLAYGCLGLSLSNSFYSVQALRGALSKLQKLIEIISILMLNLDITSKSGISKERLFASFLGSIVPVVSQWMFNEQHDRVVDLTVLSNACSLGFRCLEGNNAFGCMVAVWHISLHILLINSWNLLRISSTVPLNFGLGITSILTHHCLLEMANGNPQVERRLIY